MHSSHVLTSYQDIYRLRVRIRKDVRKHIKDQWVTSITNEVENTSIRKKVPTF